MRVKIFVDEHERRAGVDRLMESLGEVEVKTLPVGDIAIVECGLLFERKSYADLVASVQQRHLEKQLMELENSGQTVFVLVVGNSIPTEHNWGMKKHYGLLASKNIHYPRVHWVMCRDEAEMVVFIERCIVKAQEMKKKGIDGTELMQLEKLRGAESVEDINALMLSAIPGLGVAKARSILKQIGFLNIRLMQAEELAELDGVGMETAIKLKRYLG